MKPETAVKRILASDASDSLKILKLQNLALRCFPSGANQKMVIATYKAIEQRAGDRTVTV